MPPTSAFETYPKPARIPKPVSIFKASRSLKMSQNSGKFFAHPTKAGHQVSYQKGASRRTFEIAKQGQGNEDPPVAAESFSLEPAAYEELLRRVKTLNQKNAPKNPE